MREHNHDHNPKQQQAQDAVPRGRLHVNGAEGGPVSPAGKGAGGKGGGNKSPPGNGKAPPPGNGAEGARSLDTRMAVLETEHKHLATKADLEKGLSGLRKELHASELRLVEKAQENKEELRKEVQGVKDDLQATETRLRQEAQKNKEELRQEAQATETRLSKQIQEGRDETRRMPYVILVGMAALVAIVTGGPEAIDWLRELLG